MDMKNTSLEEINMLKEVFMANLIAELWQYDAYDADRWDKITAMGEDDIEIYDKTWFQERVHPQLSSY